MKKQTVTLAICTALLLAACGGDKDKDDRLPSDPGRSRIDDRQYDQRQAYHGTAYTVASSRSRTDNRDLEALNGDDLGTLRIDGKTLPARQVGIYVGGLPKLKTQGATVEGISYKNYLISGDNYKNSRFGYITHGGIDYVFSQGAFTQNMPTSGSARYEGDAAVGRDGITTAADADFNASARNATAPSALTRSISTPASAATPSIAKAKTSALAAISTAKTRAKWAASSTTTNKNCVAASAPSATNLQTERAALAALYN